MLNGHELYYMWILNRKLFTYFIIYTLMNLPLFGRYIFFVYIFFYLRDTDCISEYEYNHNEYDLIKSEEEFFI